MAIPLKLVHRDCSATTEKITLTFNKNVEKRPAETEANYTISFNDAAPLAEDEFTVRRDDPAYKRVVITPSVQGEEFPANSTLKVIVKDVHTTNQPGDKINQENDNNKFTATVTPVGGGGPAPAALSISSCTATTTQVTVIFSEAINADDAKTLDNYTIVDVDDTSATSFAKEKVDQVAPNQVIITLTGTGIPLPAGTRLKVTVQNIKNSDGREINEDGQDNVCETIVVGPDGGGGTPLTLEAIAHSIDVKLGALVMAMIGPQAYELLVTGPLTNVQIGNFIQLVGQAKEKWNSLRQNLAQIAQELEQPIFLLRPVQPTGITAFSRANVGINPMIETPAQPGSQAQVLNFNDQIALVGEINMLKEFAEREVIWLSGSFDFSDAAITIKRIRDRANEAQDQLNLLQAKVQILFAPDSPPANIQTGFTNAQKALSELLALVGQGGVQS